MKTCDFVGIKNIFNPNNYKENFPLKNYKDNFKKYMIFFLQEKKHMIY